MLRKIFCLIKTCGENQSEAADIPSKKRIQMEKDNYISTSSMMDLMFWSSKSYGETQKRFEEARLQKKIGPLAKYF